MAGDSRDSGLDGGWVFLGLILGLLIGGVSALFYTPQSGRATRQQISETGQSLRTKLETVTPIDPIAESMAEGKAAARRRRAELGLEHGD